MVCPKCGSEQVRVQDTLHDIDNVIYRRRKCIACKNTFRTIETLAPDTEDFRKKYASAAERKSGLIKKIQEEKGK